MTNTYYTPVRTLRRLVYPETTVCKSLHCRHKRRHRALQNIVRQMIPLLSSPGPTGNATLLAFPGGLVQCDSPRRGQAH